MTRQESDWIRYRQLRDQFLADYPQNPVSPELESLILGDAEKKRDFVSHIHLQSALAVSSELRQPGDAAFHQPPRLLDPLPSPVQVSDHGPRKSTRMRGVLWTACATAVVLWFGLIYLELGAIMVQVDTPIAMMGPTEDCQWESETPPATEGSALFAGRMRLISGTARLQMANTQLTLEGPVDFELISENRCRLRSGRVVMSSKDGGNGLVIIVPNGAISDFGAKIGVHVTDAGDAELHVFSGLVRAKHCALDKSLEASESDNIRIQSNTIEKRKAESSSIDFDHPVTLAGHLNTPRRSSYFPRFAQRRISTLT